MIFFIRLIDAILYKTNSDFEIVCVNLEHHQDRKQHMNNILGYSAVNYGFINAVNGREVLTNQRSINDYSLGFDMQNFMNKYRNIDEKYYGAVGLKLTHYIIMKQLIKMKSTKPLLILEDDADLEADFVIQIENTLKNMNDDWDIILLAPHYHTDSRRPYNEKTGLIGIGYFWSTYAIMINGNKSAKKLAKLIEESPLERPIDVFYGDLSRDGHIKVFAYSKQLATHLGNVFESSIGTSTFCGPSQLKKSLYWSHKENK